MTTEWRTRLRLAMVILPLLIALFAVWTLRTELLPFLLGLAIAYVLAPAVSFLARLFPERFVAYHTARALAIIVIYGLAIGGGAATGFVVVPEAVDELELFVDELPDTVDEARVRFQELYDRYVPAQYHEQTDEWLMDAGNIAADWAAGLLPGAARFLGDTFFILIGYLTLPLWLFFTLKDHPRGVRAFLGMLPPSWRLDARNVLGIGDTILRNYLKAMLLQGLLVGSMSFVILSLLDVPFPLGLAVIAGITEMIPIIGPIVGAVPAIVVALAERPLLALWVALAYIVIQQLENNLIVPKIQGDFLRLHPGVIIVLLVLAGSLGGFIFVILVIPLAALLRDIYQYAYLRLSDYPEDIALEKSLGEERATRVAERLEAGSVLPAAGLGNLGYRYEYQDDGGGPQSPGPEAGAQSGGQPAAGEEPPQGKPPPR